jgi:hypothetical protein
MAQFFLSMVFAALFITTAAAADCSVYFSNIPCGLRPESCFLLCRLCDDSILGGLLPLGANYSCSPLSAESDEAVFSAATQAYFNLSFMHGYSWMDDEGDIETNATQCFQHLLTHMPRRDLLLLTTDMYHFLDFLFEHIRFALLGRRSFAFSQTLPWELFLDAVLPYSFINEKRDLWWRWRPKFFQVMSKVVRGAQNVTAAVHALAGTIPTLQLQGIYSDTAGGVYPGVSCYQHYPAPPCLHEC